MKCRPALLGLFLLLLTIFANGCEEACEGCTGGHAGGAHFEFPVYSSPVINPGTLTSSRIRFIEKKKRVHFAGGHFVGQPVLKLHPPLNVLHKRLSRVHYM
jgi:hypothetical protein